MYARTASTSSLSLARLLGVGVAAVGMAALTATPATAQAQGQNNQNQGQQQQQQDRSQEGQNQQQQRRSDRSQQANPLYEHWSGFQPGAYSRYETETQVAGLLYTIKTDLRVQEIDESRVLVEVITDRSGPGGTSGRQSRVVEIPANLPRGEVSNPSATGAAGAIPGVAPSDVERTTSTETITTPAGEIEAEKATLNIDQGVERFTITAYVSDKVPGRLVYSETSSDGLSENQSTTRLIAYGDGSNAQSGDQGDRNNNNQGDRQESGGSSNNSNSGQQGGGN